MPAVKMFAEVSKPRVGVKLSKVAAETFQGDPACDASSENVR